jgi:hypothetical protein
MVEVWKEKMLLYKDCVGEIPKSIQPTSATWAKKHILGMSDEDIKLDINQIRMERAISAELDNTATVITRTGIFDNVDRLYKTVTGSTQPSTPTTGGPVAPPPPGGGAPPPPPPPEPEIPLADEVTPKKIGLLFEDTNNSFDEYFNHNKNNYLGEISDELDKLLNG